MCIVLHLCRTRVSTRWPVQWHSRKYLVLRKCSFTKESWEERRRTQTCWKETQWAVTWSSSGFRGVWDVSPKREFLISPKLRNESRNVFVLGQMRNDLEPGMFFPVSRLLESSMFSLMTPGSPCPEPAAVLSLVFILLCHLEQHTGLLCPSDECLWWHWAFYALSPSTPQLAPLSHPMGKVPYLLLFNRSIYLWRHLAPLCFSVKMH